MVQRYGESIKVIIEKAHIFLCKKSVGVNKQRPNVAARNELGRLSLKLDINDLNILDTFTKPARW